MRVLACHCVRDLHSLWTDLYPWTGICRMLHLSRLQ